GAETRDAQPDLRRHDAVHADRHSLPGVHVYLAGDDSLAAEFPLRRLMADRSPAQLDASAASRDIAAGRLTSLELVQACLERIRQVEPTVQAWQFLDEEHALSQARAADERRRSGEPVGALNGIPVGIKDIIDTADMPTENGTVLHKGRMPREDAAVVAKLRAAGAVIMGKTVTTECAYFNPGK